MQNKRQLEIEHAEAEAYVQAVYPVNPMWKPTGELIHLSVATLIKHTDDRHTRCVVECEAFDKALSEVIKEDFRRITMMALARMHRAAKEAPGTGYVLEPISA